MNGRSFVLLRLITVKNISGLLLIDIFDSPFNIRASSSGLYDTVIPDKVLVRLDTNSNKQAIEAVQNNSK